jgi:hypothetical protein
MVDCVLVALERLMRGEKEESFAEIENRPVEDITNMSDNHVEEGGDIETIVLEEEIKGFSEFIDTTPAWNEVE